MIYFFYFSIGQVLVHSPLPTSFASLNNYQQNGTQNNCFAAKSKYMVVLLCAHGFLSHAVTYTNDSRRTATPDIGPSCCQLRFESRVMYNLLCIMWL